MMQISLVTWQFVRLMVYLEDHPRHGCTDDLPALGEAWRELWQTMDTELAALSENDFEAYADMMMGQSVVIEEVPPAHATACAEALDDIAGELTQAIERKDKGADTAHLENLEFERSELLRKSQEVRKNLKP